MENSFVLLPRLNWIPVYKMQLLDYAQVNRCNGFRRLKALAPASKMSLAVKLPDSLLLHWLQIVVCFLWLLLVFTVSRPFCSTAHTHTLIYMYISSLMLYLLNLAGMTLELELVIITTRSSTSSHCRLPSRILPTPFTKDYWDDCHVLRLGNDWRRQVNENQKYYGVLLVLRTLRRCIGAMATPIAKDQRYGR